MDRCQERYKHLVKTHGERSDYVAGFRECMRIVAEVKAEAIKSYSAELLGKYCRYDEDGNGFVCDTDIYNLARHMEVEK